MRKQFVNNKTCLFKVAFSWLFSSKMGKSEARRMGGPGLSEKYCIGRETSACKKKHCSEGVLLMAIGELYRKS